MSPAELEAPEYEALARRMVITVTDPSQDGVGIAGPQVGILRRVVAVQRFDKEGEPFEVYPNIRIVERRGEQVCGPEGCLSVPGIYCDVTRPAEITLRYYNEKFEPVEETLDKFACRMVQHEMSHLDGTLFVDLVAPIRKKMIGKKLLNIAHGKVSTHYKSKLK